MEQLDVRTKIGLVVVSASSVSELRYPKAAPPGVAFLTSRMMLDTGGGIEALIEMESNASRAVGELVSAKVDSVAYCCTVSGALRGMEGDRAFCQELEAKWNTPITSTMLAVAEALQCPTLLNNGFGDHRIEGIGDKHVPWIQDCKKRI